MWWRHISRFKKLSAHRKIRSHLDKSWPFWRESKLATSVPDALQGLAQAQFMKRGTDIEVRFEARGTHKMFQLWQEVSPPLPFYILYGMMDAFFPYKPRDNGSCKILSLSLWLLSNSLILSFPSLSLWLHSNYPLRDLFMEWHSGDHYFTLINYLSPVILPTHPLSRLNQRLLW